MRILICGSRGWRAKDPIRAILRGHGPSTTLIQGGANGADMIAGWVAEELGIQVVKVDADWQRHGRAAGPIRNQAMLDLRPDIVYAFRTYGKSRGPDDMVRRSEAAGIPVYVVSGGPRPPSEQGSEATEAPATEETAALFH